MDLDTALHSRSGCHKLEIRHCCMVQCHRTVILCELTVPWEDHVDEAYKRKKEKYQNFIDTCKARGYQSYCYPVEVGCRGFSDYSFMKLLKDMGIFGNRQSICKRLEEAAETGSSWILLYRKR